MNAFQRHFVWIFNIFYPCKVYGKENLPKGGAILTSNHFRAIDCGFMVDVYRKDVFFLAKKELFDKKIIGGIIKSFGGIPVDRSGSDLKSFFAAARVLKDGHKLVIFPEGTRNKTGRNEMLPLKSGTAVLAVKTKSPIVPVMMEKKARFLRKTRIIVGKPFDFSEFYSKKLSDEDIIEMDGILRVKMTEAHQELIKIISEEKNKGKKNNAKKLRESTEDKNNADS